ncbi:MAG: LamG-like jellyroll fold domain-containing protein [Candidatus Kapaibacterium sp.]
MLFSKDKYSTFVLFLAVFLGIFFTAEPVFTQDYDFTLNQRRRYDQIHVEIWAKSLTQQAPKIGYGSLIIEYNNNYLRPAAQQLPWRTDSINYDVDANDPIDTVLSDFNSANGYGALGTQSYSSGYYSLEVNLARLGNGGLKPQSSGKGSFVGMLIFDIINNPADTELTEIEWSKGQLPGKIQLFDADSTNIYSQAVFTDPGNYDLLGVTVLSPNYDGQVVDRDHNYASLNGVYTGGGYPVYFERSVNPQEYTVPVDEDLAWHFEYSLDDGNTWSNIGRMVETIQSGQSIGNNSSFRSGMIYTPEAANGYMMTYQDGSQLDMDNYRGPVRVIWEKNRFFTFRSEQARLKITKLNGTISNDIASRQRSNIYDINDERFLLGRLFFVQLNGDGQYFKTDDNFSNSTQLTVEAWVNLNSLQPSGSEPAIVASSGGPDASPIQGSTEGAWMLYLKDGRYPAFRAREIESRGQDGYIGTVAAYSRDSLAAITDADPLSLQHADNWVHLAATVDDNVVSLYINGELSDRYENNNATDIRMLTTQHPIWIGVNPNGTIDADDYLHGGIKTVRVWRIALTQDEIRKRTAGVSQPTNVENYGDLRRGLELYYSFEGMKTDLAHETQYQKGAQPVTYYDDETASNSIRYRPDQPHIKITTPVQGVGVKNKQNDIYQIRWVSYGLGDITQATGSDIVIQYSTDGGITWTAVRNPAGIGYSGTSAPDVETGLADWEPYENNNATGDLRSIDPYSKETLLRIRGTSANTQEQLMDVTGPFYVAPYFSVKKNEASIITLPGNKGMNITGNTAFIEAWVKPYRFPTSEEGFMPIIEKADSANQNIHYSLGILEDGRLEFRLQDIGGNVRVARSDADKPLVRPNSVDTDSAWTHVAVYLFLNNGAGESEVRFFIDGVVQKADSITNQLGNSLQVNYNNYYPTFIGYSPSITTMGVRDSTYTDEETGEEVTVEVPVEITQPSNGYIGEIRELRLWNGIPDRVSSTGTEPTELTKFIQGAMAVKAEELLPTSSTNLFGAFSFDGGSFIDNEYNRAIGASNTSQLTMRFYGDPIEFQPVKPYIKLVEPVFKQKVANTSPNLKVRWVGFEYDGSGFYEGDPNVAPSLEFSIRGGGGDLIQPYQYLGSDYWTGNTQDAITLEADSNYVFTGTGNNIRFAVSLNAGIADPDEDNDGTFDDQGPLSASLTNARLRLTGEYTINESMKKMTTEGPLFTVTPASNFTVRVLLEGYHNGAENGREITPLPPTYEEGGLEIKLYTDNSGGIGDLVDSSESLQGYDDRSLANRNSGNNRFSNVNFVFTELTDGNYWVVVDHPNHLPVMSRYAAPFMYEGDDRTTWIIESGWDFTGWNGEDNNVLNDVSTDPWAGRYYTAAGDAISTVTDPRYSSTGLVYNSGVAGTQQSSMPAMVGGDVDKSGQIDAADRVRVRLDNGTALVRSDITGDGVVNADDRTITDRNFGKISSIWSENLPGMPARTDIDPWEAVSEDAPALSAYFNDNAQNTPLVIDKNKSDRLMAFIDYTVTAEPYEKDGFIYLPMYIKNNGSTFGLANCTFAVKYNSNVLDFIDLVQEEEVIFSNKPGKGYSELATAPKADAQNPLPDVRTIEIDYDAYAMLEGEILPIEKTYLGTLRFSMKNGGSAITFNWHHATSVHSLDGEIITEEGHFLPITTLLLYGLQLEAPNGGERIGPNEPYTIKWSTDGSAQAYIELSTNSGTTWNKIIDETVDVAAGSYEWAVPDISSTQCMIRIVDKETGTELDRSDAVFSILPDFAQIIRPSTGDPVYTGGSNDRIVWSAQGYSNVYFEFSSDAGTTWKKVAGPVDITMNETNWKLPDVTTKKAMLRMIDAESDEVVATTGMFKVLSGEVQFRTPKEGETLISGNLTRIRWNAVDVELFDIDLSTDGGMSWERLFTNADAARRYKDWKAPVVETDRAMLRAIWLGDPEMEYNRTGEFTITSGTSVEETFESNFKLFPVPADEYFYIEINPEYLGATLEIMDLTGISVKNIELNDQTIKIETGNLTPGAYFVRIEKNEKTFTGRINIIR